MLTVQSIEFTYKEGYGGESLPLTFTTWAGANEKLRQWATHIPVSGGYDKTGYKVTWNDGSAFGGRLDLAYRHHSSRDILQNDITHGLKIDSGEHRPFSMSQRDYDELISGVTLTERQEAKAYLTDHCWEDKQTGDTMTVFPEAIYVLHHGSAYGPFMTDRAAKRLNGQPIRGSELNPDLIKRDSSANRMFYYMYCREVGK